MNGTAIMSPRVIARRLPQFERKRRLATCEAAPRADVLRAVVAAGVGGGVWRSNADAADEFGIGDRTFRRMLSGAEPIEDRFFNQTLIVMAFAFGVEVSK